MRASTSVDLSALAPGEYQLLLAFMEQAGEVMNRDQLMNRIRELDLKKTPSISETLDWARALLALNADELEDQIVSDTPAPIEELRDTPESWVEAITPIRVPPCSLPNSARSAEIVVRACSQEAAPSVGPRTSVSRSSSSHPKP